MYRYLFCFLLLFSSCSSSITDEPYNPLELFDESLGIGFTVSPAGIVHGETNSIVLTVQPIFQGTGHFSIVGHGGGQPIGQIVSPVNEELGTVCFPVEFMGEGPCELRWEIQFDSEISHVGISFEATYDSLLIGGVQYDINSPKSRDLIGGGAVYSIYRHVTLDVAE